MKGGHQEGRLRVIRYRTLIAIAAAIGLGGGVIAAAYYYVLAGALHLVWGVLARMMGPIWLVTGIGGLLVGLSLRYLGRPGEIAAVVDNIHLKRGRIASAYPGELPMKLLFWGEYQLRDLLLGAHRGQRRACPTRPLGDIDGPGDRSGQPGELPPDHPGAADPDAASATGPAAPESPRPQRPRVGAEAWRGERTPRLIVIPAQTEERIARDHL